MSFEPVPHLGLLVIRGVVQDQVNPVAFAVVGWQQSLVQERQVGAGVEVIGLMPPDELAFGNTDSPQHFLGVAFSASGNLRLTALARPSARQRGRLPERRFILVNDQRFLGPGFFLRLGYW